MFNYHPSKLQEHRQPNKATHIFSTEISSLSNLDNQSLAEPKNIPKIHSKFIDQPTIHLKKIKNQRRQLDEEMTTQQRHYFRIRNSLESRYREIAVSRYQFLKLYSVKKCKKQTKQLRDYSLNERQTGCKQKIYKAKKQRYGEQISILIRKQQSQKMMQELRQKNIEQKQSWKDALVENQLRFSHTLYDKIKKRKQEKLESQIRKKNFSELSTTKSKFNYLSKINEEMMAIKNYQELLDNPQELIRQRLTQQKQNGSVFSSTFTTGFNPSNFPCQYQY